MAINLSRATYVYWSTEDGGTPADISSSNTYQIQVLDGFSLTQSSETATIQLSEAGVAPVRGQRSFNTQLNPAEWSFTTYIRPYDGGTVVKAPEFPMWAALLGADAVGSAWTAAAPAVATTAGSNVNQLLPFYLFFVIDNVIYRLENCAVNQAEIQFDLQGIAQVTWSGFANKLTDVTGATLKAALTAITFPVTADADTFITNKLSTVQLESGFGLAGTAYTVPLTGGSFTYSNNIEFVTPASLGVVNNSIGYYTGSRSITGTLNAYLKTGGTGDTGALLNQVLSDSATTTEPKYSLQLEIGGSGNSTRIELYMPSIFLQIPNIDVQDVVSVAMDFTAQGSSGANYDLTQTNDLTVRYHHAV